MIATVLLLGIAGLLAAVIAAAVFIGVQRARHTTPARCGRCARVIRRTDWIVQPELPTGILCGPCASTARQAD